MVESKGVNMRTAILIGSVIIGDAINPTNLNDPNVIKFVGIIILVAMVMDVVDFFRGKN